MREKPIILVAEGDDNHFVCFRKNLQRMQFEVFRFSDGPGLLAALEQYQNAEMVLSRPCLLFLDLQLPEANSLEILETIKSSPMLKKLPVVILLSGEDEQVLEECYRRGCAFCLRKPVLPDRLEEVIRRVSDFLSVVDLPELAVLNLTGGQ